MQSTSQGVIDEVKARTDTVLLAFSIGKDSIGAWIELRKHFRVVPFYQFYVPGLEFVERSLRYYEQVFGCDQPMVQVPHRKFWLWLQESAFQCPASSELLEEVDIPEYRVYDIADWLRDDMGLPDAYLAISMRAADNLSRRIQIKQRGAVNHARKTFYPIPDWDDARLAGEIEAAGVKLPVDYRLFSRSFEGLRNEFLAPIARHYPEDWARILAWFPWAGLELERHRMFSRGNRIQEA